MSNRKSYMDGLLSDLAKAYKKLEAGEIDVKTADALSNNAGKRIKLMIHDEVMNLEVAKANKTALARSKYFTEGGTSEEK